MIHKLIFTLFVGLGLGAGVAATPAAAQYAFANVQIEGLQRIEPQTVLSYLGVAKGENVSAAQLNDGYQRLVASGLFENVELIPRGGTLVIRVSEHPTINRISIEGNKRLRDKVLLELLQSKPRHVFSPSTAEQDAEAIVRAYQAQGRYGVVVEPKLIRRANNRVDLVFEVTESKNTEVNRISFVGNRAFSDNRLRRVLETKQAGLLRAIIKADTFVPERIEFDKRVLTDFYNSRGYPDFQVVSVSSDLTRERDAVFITFDVREGAKFSFGEVRAVSALPEVDAAEYQRAIRIRPGQTYSPQALERAVARLEELAIRQGLNFVRVTPRITRDDANQLLNVDLVIERGPRIIVERIDIEGNATTLDRVIRAQFTTAEGDPFNPRAIRAASQRIRALGFFANVDVQARDGTAPGNVIIDVNVEEKPTGSFSFGGIYSNQSGFGLNLSYSERNFLGRGQFLKLAFTTGKDNGSFDFTFVEPQLFGRDLRAGLDAYFRRTTATDLAPYDSQRIRFAPSLEFPVSENGRLSLRAFVSGANIENVQPGASALITADAARGQQVGTGAGFTYSWDNRRGGLEPDMVLRFNLGSDVGGFGSDYTWARTTAMAAAQARVFNDQVTLRATIEGGALVSTNGAASRVTDRFFMDTSRMRGFGAFGMGPRDPATGDAVGGNYFAVARFEAEFPLGLPEEYGISGGLFYDVGSLWGLDDTLGGAIDDASYTRQVIGASLFWKTPIGPLRFNWSHALAKESYDVENTFEFTISTSF